MRIPIVRISLIEAPQVIMADAEGQSMVAPFPEGAVCHRELLVYLPGTDGTGIGISPQLPALQAGGFDVLALYFPPEERPTWEELVGDLVPLLRAALADHRRRFPSSAERITLVGESFGGALALRVALEAPELLERMVIVNPATSFRSSLGGLSNLIASSNLLGIFPENMYVVAQAVLFPFLVDSERLSTRGQAIVRSLMDMSLMSFDTAAPSTSVGAVLNANVPPPRVRQVHAKDRAGPSGQPLTPKSTFVASGSANWRFQLLRQADLEDPVLRRVAVPTLLLASARDRLLPSTEETARLHALIPGSRRVIFPESCHTLLMEGGFDLVEAMTTMSGLIDQLPCQLLTKEQLDEAADASDPTMRSSGLVISVESNPTELLAAVDQLERLERTPSVVVLQSRPEEEGRGEAVRVLATSELRGRAEREAALASLMEVAALAPRVAGPSASAAGPGTHRAPSSSQPGNHAKASRPAASDEPPSASPRVRVNPSNDRMWERAGALMAPWKALTAPLLLGTEHLPSVSPAHGAPSGLQRPVLFVANHTFLGLYDTPVVMHELYLRGIKVRGLAHEGHFMGPAKGLFEEFGAVKATPRAAFKLLSEGEAVLLFPGGAKEVLKRRGQEYKLLWNKEQDFIRLAARTNAIIIPFACLGGDDAFKFALDSDEVLANPVLGPAVRSLYQRFAPDLNPQETVYPLTALPLPSPVPIPSPIPVPSSIERIYISFRKPIDPAALLTDRRDPAASSAVYYAVQQSVLDGIEELKAFREADPDRNIGARLTRGISRLLPDWGLLTRRG